MARNFLKGFEGTVPRRTSTGKPTTDTVSGFFIVAFGPYNPSEKKIVILLLEFESKAAWEGGQDYINQYRYDINESLGFNTYFSEAALKGANKTLLTQAVALLSTIDGTHPADQNNLDLTQFTEAT